MTEKDEEKLDYEELEEDNDELEESILQRYQINSYSVDRPIETLIKWKQNGKLIVPEFQREYVWTYNNSAKFIDSILLSLPIPNIFVFKLIQNNVEKYLLVDGMQRITTMEQFYNGKWSQNGKEKDFIINLKSSTWYNKDYNSLEEEDKQFFLDYPISVMIFETSGPEKFNYNDSIFSVFERINTGSEKLTNQEIRNAVYQGECLKKIKKACQLGYYQNLIDRDTKILKRDKYVELFIRLLTYKRIYFNICKGVDFLVEKIPDSKIINSKRIMLNAYLNCSNKKMIDYEKEVDEIIKACEVICKKDRTLLYNINRNTRNIGKRVHEIFAEALIISVIKNNYKIDAEIESVKEQKANIWKDRDLFYNLLSSNTTDPNSLKKRVEYIYEIIKG